MKPEHNAEYISKIRMRLCDDALARKEREKRRRRVLVEQLAAHEAIEQTKHEDMLVTCLMRQSQLERRIALQLLQVRLEKDVVRNNRLQREQQYMQRRLKDFDEALNHEAEVARLTKKEYQEQCEKELARHETIALENQHAKYQKRYNICKETLMQIVDFSCIAGYYKELSEQPIPCSMWREWKSLFVAGKPFYDDANSAPVSVETDNEAVSVLNECNMNQYTALSGEWAPPEEHPEISPNIPPQNNYILGHILKRLTDIVYPPSKPPTPPQFPEFPIKACFLGKTFSGKSSVLQALSAKKRLKILDIDVLVDEAVSAYSSNETVEVTEIVEVPPTPKPTEEEKTTETTTETETAGTEETVPAPEASPEVSLSPGPTLQTVTKQVPSPRAVLGKAVESSMSKGKSIPIQTLVDIVVLGIRGVPEGTGWILDNFPKTLKQAKVLERALSGFVSSSTGLDSRQSMLSTPAVSSARGTPSGATPRNTPSPSKAPKNGKKGKKNVLVEEPDCDKATPLPPPVSGIDIVLHLSVPDKTAIKRACGRRKHKNGEEYHEEHRPPPEGSYTGVPPTYDEFNVKHSPSPEIEAVEDDASQQIQSRLVTFGEEWPRLEKWFGMFNNLVTVDAQGPLSNVEENVEDILTVVLEKKLKPPTPAPTPAAAAVDTPVSGGEEPPAAETPASGGDATPAPEGVPDTIPEETPKPPLPAPGSDEWEYVDEPIPHDSAHILYPQWELVQDSYLKLCKHTFKKIREERETIIRYFYATKKNFLVFLQRPDNKQTFVTSWIKNYNSVSEDMREDNEMKAELHQTVEDLRERLWDISDKKKEEAEEERQIIITEQWLEDHIGLLTNHYIQLMQAEVDRYQGSVRLIRDYYQVIEGKILDEPKKDFTRVPLVDLPRTDTPLPPSEEKNDRSSARSDRSRSAGKVQSSPSGQTPVVPAVESEESGEAEVQRRIPLVSRKTFERESKAETPQSGRKSAAARRETPEQDCQEAQIVEAFMSGLAVIEQLKAPSAEEEDKDGGKGKAKGKDKGKPKKGKKSASPAATPTVGTPVPELTPEEIARQKMLERAALEGAAAVLSEDRSFSLKLAVIKLRAITVIKELKERAAQMYVIQQDWIGQRFKKEMDSIKTMSEMLSDVIESEKAILPQVVLSDDTFTVDMGYKMFEPPLEPPPDAPIEIPTPDILTIAQIQELHKNLREVAPSGYISLDLLVEMFEPPAFLPEIWMNVTTLQLEDMFSRHLCETKYINWQIVLLSCLSPIPLPNQSQLIDTANQYEKIDSAGSGRLDMAGYAQGDLWFSGNYSLASDGSAQFDRLGHIKTTLFTLICDENYTVDYIDFLLLFCSDPEPGNGALKALSVVTGQPVEWPHYIESPDPSGSVQSIAGAEAEFPTRKIPITLDQLLRVVSFNRMETDSLKLVKEEMVGVFKELEEKDGTADVGSILVHPRGRKIILHHPSFVLVDYRSILMEAAVQDAKFGDRVSQPLL